MKNKLNSLKERVKKNFKENKVLFFVFAIVWIATIIFTLTYFSATLGKQSIGNESYNRSVVEIDKNTAITQTVEVEDKAESVSVLFATYARNNKGNVDITVIGNDSGKVYAKNSYDVSTMQDNAYITNKLSEPLDIKNDKTINIVISSDSNSGEAVGIYYSNVKAFENSSLKINNEEVSEADLCIKFLVYNDDLNVFSNSVIICSIIGITLIALLVLLINPKPEVLFAAVLLILGLIMMIIIVPASPPDELLHYEASLQVSNIMMFSENPKLIDSIYLKYGYMYGHYNISPGYIRFINEFGKPLKLTGLIFEIPRKIEGLYLFQYLPSAIGITLGRLLNLNMITTFYLGRFTTLLFYICCIYIAIKNTPSHKFLFGILASLPIFVQISISITYDAFILGLSFLTLAYFLKWYHSDTEIDIKEIIFVFLVCLALAPAKVLYSFFAFIYVLIPYKKYGGKIKKLLICLLICAPAIYQLYGIMAGPIKLFFNVIADPNTDNMLYINNIKNNLLATTSNSQKVNDVSVPTEVFSFKFMFKHPIETIVIFARTIRYQIKSWFYGAIGRTLSGETLVLPITITRLLAIITIVSAFIETEHVLNIPTKLWLVVMCVVIGLYAMVGMFVSWTNVNQTIIEDYGGIIVEGIQGRYFSPVLPYLYVTFANRKLKLPKKSEKYVLLSYLIIFFVIVIYVLSYTFVN